MSASITPAASDSRGGGLSNEDVLPTLQRATCGNRRLDLMIAFALGRVQIDSAVVLRLLLDSDSGQEQLGALLDDSCPPYTTSLDASLPQENIILALYQPQKQIWTAVHRSPSGGDVVGTGASEVLARRIAVLKAMASTRDPAPEPSERDIPRISQEPGGPPGDGDASMPGRGRSTPSDSDDWEILW
tara:strand:+ start:249 stop:809 length:561 start_codon:yes stop_codon:yes gene_type:complete